MTGWQSRAARQPAAGCPQGEQRSNRSPRKITAAALLSSLCAQCHGGTASFNDIATALDAASGRQPSRQSVAERFAQPCLRLIQTVLRLAIDRRVTTSMLEDAPALGLLQPYSRVLVQDSTITRAAGLVV